MEKLTLSSVKIDQDVPGIHDVLQYKILAKGPRVPEIPDVPNDLKYPEFCRT